MTEKRFIPHIILAVSVLIYWFVLTGGVDFGYHWDERHLMKSTARVPETGLVLPGWYNYPSMSFVLTLISFAAYIAWETVQQSIAFLAGTGEAATGPLRTLAKTALERQQELIFTHSDTQQKNEFWIFVRIVFASLTTLSVPVIYLAVSRLVDRWIALAVALVLMGSFHVFFHARWIAPDMLQVLWMALLLLFTVSFLQKGGGWRLTAVTVLSGVMIATKYPAGIFLLCPLTLVNLERFTLAGSARVIFLAFVWYLAITPGTFIEPRQFAYGILYELRHYAEKGHEVSTVEPGLTHLGLMAEYFAFRLFNMNPFISLLLWVFILIGIAEGAVRHRQLTLSVLLPALLYFLYLSTQKVMIIRNTLILLPVFCLYLALGLDRVRRTFGQYDTPAKMGTTLIAAVIFAVSISDHAAVNKTLEYRSFGKEAAERILATAREHDGTTYVSDEVAGLLRRSELVTEEQLKRPAGIDRFDTSARAIYMISDTVKKDNYFEEADWTWIGLANRRGLYTTLVGPQDVDLNYYPNWKGLDRIVVTSHDSGSNFAYWKLSAPWKLELPN